MSTEIQKNETGQAVEPANVGRRVAPFIDIYENDERFLVHADMPGVRPDGLTIEVENGQLVLEGAPAPLPEGSPLDAAIEPITYARTLRLPRSIDTEHISAKIEHGVLTLELPKREALRTRQIHVQAG